MQKLVTVYLDSEVYLKNTFFKVADLEKHGFVEEHLTQYLDDGWQIVDLQATAGGSNVSTRGWIVAVLERAM